MQLHHRVSLIAIATTLFAIVAPAEAVTITGTFRYEDKDQTGARLDRPIAFADVDILMNSGQLARITTDANGQINFSRSDLCCGVFAVNVYATNYATTVLGAVAGPWAGQPGEASPIWRWSASSAAVLDFSYVFRDGNYRQNYNIAETIRRGFDYAAARRDPHETDTIPRVQVSLSTWENIFGTRYNRPTQSLLFNTSAVMPRASDGLMNDFTILHEYCHFLEDMISTYLVVPSNHEGCRMAEATADLVNNPENTWPEAFCEYFGRVVPMVAPPDAQLIGPDNVLTTGLDELESPNACDAVGMRNVNGDLIGPDAVEDFVAAVLWDLVDQPIDGAFGGTNRDFVSGADVVIFQILDHELDGSGSTFPNMRRFHDAWAARGLDHAGLDRILGGIMPALATDANNTIVSMNVALDDAGWGTSPGTPAIVWGATGGTNQQWTYFKGRLRNHNPTGTMCLSADPTAGELDPCQSTPAQQWRFRGQIRSVDNKCLQRSGTVVSLGTCSANASQLWELDGDAIRQGGLCLELGANGIFVAKGCYGTTLQRWARTSLGQLVQADAPSVCLTVATPAALLPLPEGSTVTRALCAGDNHLQRWQLVGDVVHSVDGTCLEITDANPWWGNQTHAVACTAGPAQDWTYFAEAR